MRIVFLCPPIGKLNGGIKYIFRMAETLCADGFDAVVCEQDKAKPSWFTSNAPLIGYDALQPRQGDILVLPEDQPDMLRTLATWPQRKIIYCQNQFYAALGTTGATSYADYGVTDILCSSQTIRAYCAERHPQIPTHLVPCSVDSTLFKPSAKIEQIAYAPRKRMIESAYLQDMFHHHYPQWRAVPWLELSNLSEAQIAAGMASSALFLALSRLDGFGLTPIEAMAAGCVVAGFTGIGGREYATSANGFWAEEDDFPACLLALEQAMQLWQTGESPLAAYHAAANATAARYTPTVFASACRDAWTSIMLA
jgi:hypothetical protein